MCVLLPETKIWLGHCRYSPQVWTKHIKLRTGDMIFSRPAAPSPQVSLDWSTSAPTNRHSSKGFAAARNQPDLLPPYTLHAYVLYSATITNSRMKHWETRGAPYSRLAATRVADQDASPDVSAEPPVGAVAFCAGHSSRPVIVSPSTDSTPLNTNGSGPPGLGRPLLSVTSRPARVPINAPGNMYG